MDVEGMDYNGNELIAMLALTDSEKMNLNDLAGARQFVGRKRRPVPGDVFYSLDRGHFVVVPFGGVKVDGDDFLCWYPNSDQLHELIHGYGYEVSLMSEREPKGAVRITLVKYRPDSERISGTNPIVNMIRCVGGSLREAFLEGLVKVMRSGI